MLFCAALYAQLQGHAMPQLTGELAAIGEAYDRAATVFEAMTDLVDLRPERVNIAFHAWGEAQCCLPKGATQAFLVGYVDVLDLY